MLGERDIVCRNDLLECGKRRAAYFVALKGRAPSRRVNAERENVFPLWPKRMGAAGRLSLGWMGNLAALGLEAEALDSEAEALCLLKAVPCSSPSM